MPQALLDASVRFPVAYAPWYVYKATLVGSPTAFEYGDALFPDAAGLFDRIETNEAVLDIGYAFALEPFVVGMTEVTVAVPGSAIPFIASAVIRPEQLVMLGFAATQQSVIPALAANIPEGKILGRFRNFHITHNILRVTAADDIVVVLTGVI